MTFYATLTRSRLSSQQMVMLTSTISVSLVFHSNGDRRHPHPLRHLLRARLCRNLVNMTRLFGRALWTLVHHSLYRPSRR